MQTLPIPYKIEGDKLFMQQLRWPNRCACCGSPNPSAHVRISTSARSTSETVGSITTKSGYPLGWEVPYCDVCVRHSGKYINPWGPLLILCFGFWFGLGYLLFLAGLANDTIAIVGFILAIVLSAAGAYALSRWLDTWQAKGIGLLMTPSCSYHRLAIKVSSNNAAILFSFYNDDILREFAYLNGTG
jgi:hypothetical protein